MSWRSSGKTCEGSDQRRRFFFPFPFIFSHLTILKWKLEKQQQNNNNNKPPSPAGMCDLWRLLIAYYLLKIIFIVILLTFYRGPACKWRTFEIFIPNLINDARGGWNLQQQRLTPKVRFSEWMFKYQLFWCLLCSWSFSELFHLEILLMENWVTCSCCIPTL